MDGLCSRRVKEDGWRWCALPAVLAPLLPTMWVAVLCAAALGLSWMRGQGMTLTRAGRYFQLYAALCAVSVLGSPVPWTSLRESALQALFILLALLLSAQLDGRAKLLRVVEGLVLTGGLVAGLGIVQWLLRPSAQPGGWVDGTAFDISYRATATLANPNVLGQYLILVLPLAPALLMGERRSLYRLLWGGSLCAMALCLALTYSRGAWLGFVCGAAVFCLLYNWRLVALVLSALAALAALVPGAAQRFFSAASLADSSASYRVTIWRGTLGLVKDYWLLGAGSGSFPAVYPDYAVGAAAALHAHNLTLQILAEGGTAALLAFRLAVAASMKRLWSALRGQGGGPGRLLRIALASGLTGFQVQGIVDDAFYNHRVAFLFWVCLALCMAAGNWEELK